MSFMDAINQAILNAARQQGAVAAAPAAAPVEEAAAAGAGAGGAGGFWGALAPGGQPIDVNAVLTQRMAARGGPALNWKTSIADLMRLLDLDPSLDNRKALATELGYTGEKDGSAEMNIWLHRKVMEGLAANGGQVPANMAD
jgi:hypothetical protein